MPQDEVIPPRLARRLGPADAVFVGLAAMIGAGVFSAFGPATAAAGRWLPAALAVAAVVAFCNATSSARLAARHPSSGGTYVYGREQLGPFWGHLAGWSFVVGKTASCAAMALTVGAYLWPDQARVVAVVTVAVVAALDCAGVRRSAAVGRVVVLVVLAVIMAVVVVGWLADRPVGADVPTPGPTGILQAAGLLFFAFAGYARLATLGEEVRDPARVIPRAVAVALGVTVVVYLALAVTVLRVPGAAATAAAADPLVAVVTAAGVPGLGSVVRVAAVVAAAGALLSLLLGVSRTALAMARDGHLPRTLTAVHPRAGVPHHATLAVGAVAALAAATVDLREAIGFSSFGVLLYYAVANAAAWTLTAAQGRPPRVVPAVGLTGCLVLAVTLPRSSVVAGAAVVAVGAVAYLVRRR